MVETQILNGKGVVDMLSFFNKRIADLEGRLNDLEQKLRESLRESNGEEITNLYSEINKLKTRIEVFEKLNKDLEGEF